MSGLTFSMVWSATDTKTRHVGIQEVLNAIRTGGKRLKGQIAQIRNRFEAELAITGERKKAKLAVDPLKKQLPGVMWSGTFSQRANDKLIKYSGLLCADLDSLGEKLAEVRANLMASPYVVAIFLSPSGDGLKVIFRVPADAEKHLASFRVVERHIRELTGIQIDEACKDVARLCFVSYDPDIYYNPNATEIELLSEPEKPKRVQPNGELPSDMPLRERVARELLTSLIWSAEKGGYFCKCPGESDHENGTAQKHCIVYLDSVPTIKCQHNSCSKVVEAFNHQLRSLITEAERKAKSEPRKSAATQLVEFASEFAFFHDPQDRPFVRLEIKEHTEIWPVESSKFRKLLARIYYENAKKAINRNALVDAITALAGKACHDGHEEPVFLRVAPHGENKHPDRSL